MRALFGVVAVLLLGCGEGSAPLADPGPDRSVQVGEKVSFDGAASRGAIEHYQWDFGDGSPPSEGILATHGFAAEGAYSVSLTVQGPKGSSTRAAVVTVGQACSAKAVITVVTASPEPQLPVQLSGANSKGCAGAPIATYHWDFGDGESFAGPQAVISHTYAARGTYQVLLKVVDGNGLEGRASRTLNVGITPGKPQAVCPSGVSAISGRPTVFTGSGVDPAGASISGYRWTFSDDTSGVSGASVSHTFASPGSFTASLVVETDDGRKSDPCVSPVTVVAPTSFSGNWLLLAASPTLSGCSLFTPAFPAAALQLSHSGNSLTGVASGNGWVGGSLTGSEESPEGSARFRLEVIAPSKDFSGNGCGLALPQHVVTLLFQSATSATGSWAVVHDFACVGTSCSTACNCLARVDFTATRQ